MRTSVRDIKGKRDEEGEDVLNHGHPIGIVIVVDGAAKALARPRHPSGSGCTPSAQAQGPKRWAASAETLRGTSEASRPAV